MVNTSTAAVMKVSGLLTTAEVARRLDVIPGTVVTWIRYGELRAIRFGGIWLTTEEDLADFLSRRGEVAYAS